MKKKLKKVLKDKKKLKLYFYRILFFIFAYLLIIIVANRLQTTLTFPAVFYDVQKLSGYVKTDLKFEEINIKDNKGNNINALYVDGKSSQTIYYFHGNGGPLSFFYSEIKFLKDLGYNVISYDYPGYGKSTGFPYEKNVYNFSKTFYNYIKKEKGIKDKDLIVWGYSIGTTAATDFAFKHNNISKLVLISPLSSRYDMSKKLFGFVVQKFLFLQNSFISSDKIKFISVPTLIIHGNNDKIVPFWQGKKIFRNSISNNKYFIELDNFGHNYIINIYGKLLGDIIKKFLVTGKLDNRYYYIDKIEKDKLQEKVNKKEILNKLDLDTDNSITKFVNSYISFKTINYKPNNLEKIKSEYIIDLKGGNQQLRKIAKNNLEKMAKDFYNNFNEKIAIASAYRSYNYQVSIKSGGCPDNLCAKAGFSEHQSGLAIDLWEASTKYRWKTDPKLKRYYKWLDNNAYKYGFHNTYQKGLNIDSYEIEPWHFRYLGIPLATYLHDNKLTFAEYYYKKKGN